MDHHSSSSLKVGAGVAVVLTLLCVLSTPAVAKPQDKVTICHATSSVTNPYVQNTVNENAIVKPNGQTKGHGEHTGPVYPEPGWGDIIPSFQYTNDHGGTSTYPGLHWDTDGQAVWNGGCLVVPTEPPPEPEVTTTTSGATTTTSGSTTTTHGSTTTTTSGSTTTTHGSTTSTSSSTTTSSSPSSTTAPTHPGEGTTTTLPPTTTPTTAPPSRASASDHRSRRRCGNRASRRGSGRGPGPRRRRPWDAVRVTAHISRGRGGHNYAPDHDHHATHCAAGEYRAERNGDAPHSAGTHPGWRITFLRIASTLSAWNKLRPIR